MFDTLRSRIREKMYEVDERLTGVSHDTNAEASRRELSRILGSPAAQSEIEFGLEYVELDQKFKSQE